MPAVPSGPLTKPELARIALQLRQRLRRGVSLEVWARDIVDGAAADSADAGDSTEERFDHSQDAVAVCRQIATLHPGVTFTTYDLERHAERAGRAGIEMSPTILMRSAGRSIEFVGMPYGPLFPRFLDAIAFLSMGQTPIPPEARERLQGLEGDVRIEAFVTPFDPFSEGMMPLLIAFATEAKRVRLRLVEASQFPDLAAEREVTEVPLLVINGQRFKGYWDGPRLAEQVQRVAAGSEEPVARGRVLAAEYVTEAEARRVALEQQARQAASGEAGPAEGSPAEQEAVQGGAGQAASGLILPGQAGWPGEPPPTPGGDR